MKSKDTDWEKNLQNFVSHKELIFSIYKEFSKFNNMKQTMPPTLPPKGTKDLNRHFIEADLWMIST